VTQELTGNSIPEAEPAFGFHARPVDGATTARLGQLNLPVKQRDHVPGRDAADDEGGAGPGDQEGARFGAAERILVIQEGGGDTFGGCGGCVSGGVVVVQDGFRVDLVEDHDGGVLAGLSGGSRWWFCFRLRIRF